MRRLRTSIPLGLGLLCALLLRPHTSPTPAAASPTDGDAVGYAKLLAGLDARIRSLEQRTEHDPASWLDHDRVARLIPLDIAKRLRERLKRKGA